MNRHASRIIFLVDMNAFFISCEMARNPELKGHPAAVAGDPKNRTGIILAANYDARKFGVKTTMHVHEALNLCPGLILVPPTRGLYAKKSREVMEILSRFTPVIQKNSIDEAWLDLTGCEGLFGNPVQIAEKIMNDIINELDLWCSIGISENKFLAKMASEMKKPLGITELWEKNTEKKLWPLRVGEMYGIGKQTEKRLNEMCIITIGDLACCSEEVLRCEFGKYGDEMKRLANGIDPSPVVPNEYDTGIKSISRSITLSKDITDIERAMTVILALVEEVGEDARRKNFKGKTASIVIRYADFKTITRQKTIAPSFLTREIYTACCELLKDNWDSGKPVRLLGVGISNAYTDNYAHEQLSIFDVNEELQDDVTKEEKLEKTIDTIRSRFGKDKLVRAKFVDGARKQEG